MRSTTLTKRTLSSGQVLAHEVHRRERLERRDVARAAMTTSGSPPWSLLAQSQMPMPRVQCAMAWSMDSQLGLGCLPATITLT